MCQPAANWAKKPSSVPNKTTWEGRSQYTFIYICSLSFILHAILILLAALAFFKYILKEVLLEY